MTHTEKELLEFATELDRVQREVRRLQSFNQLDVVYQKTAEQGGDGGPYTWQVEFHDAGRDNAQRAIVAANRVGKTRTIAVECAMHLTGRYPSWWTGRRFDGPTDGLVCGQTNQDVRDITQLSLFGSIDENHKPDGTGWVPRDLIGPCTFSQCGVTNVLDTVRVTHEPTGRWSNVMFKSYQQGASKFQGFTKDWAWMDEEPERSDQDIFGEVQTRLLDRRGILMFSRTPLFGMSEIVKHFLDGGPGIWYVTATWDDAPHLDFDAKAEQLQRYLPHERDTRTKGMPMMGTGMVYTTPDDLITCEPFPIPKHFRRIVGIDFGIDHPGAAAWLAYDADADIVYITDCYKERNWTSLQHSHRIKQAGKHIPVAWPHDGMVRDKGGGIALKTQYENHGVNMLAIPACYDEYKLGGQAREPVTLEILERMETGRFKVFSNLHPWFDEKRMLHRKDGKIVAERDDIESATRYAVMMKRYAASGVEASLTKPASVDQGTYDPLAAVSA